MDLIVKQAAQAIDSAPVTPRLEVIWGVLHILSQLKPRPTGLVHQSYRWCLLIWRNRHSYEDWEKLLLLSLELGLRPCYTSRGLREIPLIGGELHQGVYDTVLKSNNNEAVTDLVWGSLMFDKTGGLGLSICADYIIDHRGRATETFTEHLRRFIISMVARMRFRAFGQVGKERVVELLNRLHIGTEGTRPWQANSWAALLLLLIRSTEARHLAIHSWELLAELAAGGFLSILSPLREVIGGYWQDRVSRREAWLSGPDCASFVDVEGWDKLDVATSLMDAEEWDKLECWMSVVWMVWPVEAGEVTKELEDVMGALEKQRPGAVRKRMERWNEENGRRLPESYQQTFDKLTL